MDSRNSHNNGNAFDIEKAKAEQVVRKGLFGGARLFCYGLTDDEKAEIYRKGSLIYFEEEKQQEEKEDGGKEAGLLLKLLSEQALQILSPDNTTQTSQFSAGDREARYHDAPHIATSPYTIQLVATLVTWVDKRDKQNGNNSRARFVLAIDQACQCILHEKNAMTRIEYWEKIQRILNNVSSCHLSGTHAIDRQIKNHIPTPIKTLVGMQRSEMSFRSQLWDASEYARLNMEYEKAAQTQQAMQEDLKQLNKAMSAVTSTALGLTCELFSGLKNELPAFIRCENMVPKRNPAITSLVAMLPLMNTAVNCDAYYEQDRKTLTPLAKNIQILNVHFKIILAQNKKDERNEEKDNDAVKISADRIAQLPSDNDKARRNAFVAQLRALRNSDPKQLTIDDTGSIHIFDANRKELCSFPSGFDAAIVEDTAMREQAIDSYIEILVLRQQLENRLALNEKYLQYLHKFGQVSAFVILGNEFCIQMEKENQLLIDTFYNKIKKYRQDVSKFHRKSRELDSVGRGNQGEQAEICLSRCAEIIRNTISKNVGQVRTSVSNIQMKRQKLIDELSDPYLHRDGAQDLIDQHALYAASQELLGMTVDPLPMERILAHAQAMDQAIQVLIAAPPREVLSSSSSSFSSSEAAEAEEAMPPSPQQSPLSTMERILTHAQAIDQATQVLIAAPPREVLSSFSSSEAAEAEEAMPPSPQQSPLSTTAMLSSALNSDEGKDEPLDDTKEEDTSVAPILPMCTYAGNQWASTNFQKFDTARKTLNPSAVEIKEDVLTELFKSYVPAPTLQAAPQQADAEPHQPDFNSQINSINNIATALKNKVGVLQGLFSWTQTHARAARLALCKEMVEIFEHTVNNNLLDEKEIKRMADALNKKLYAQQGWWSWALNKNLKTLQATLKSQEKLAIENYNKLLKINSWIDSNSKHQEAEVQALEAKEAEEAEEAEAQLLDTNISQIQKQMNYLNSVPKAYRALKTTIQTSLENYVMNHSTIAKELEKIEREAAAIDLDQAKTARLSNELTVLKEKTKDIIATLFPKKNRLTDRINSVGETLDRLTATILQKQTEQERMEETARATKEKIQALQAYMAKRLRALEQDKSCPEVKNQLNIIKEILEKRSNISYEDKIAIDAALWTAMSQPHPVFTGSPYYHIIKHIAKEMEIKIYEDMFGKPPQQQESPVSAHAVTANVSVSKVPSSVNSDLGISASIRYLIQKYIKSELGADSFDKDSNTGYKFKPFMKPCNKTIEQLAADMVTAKIKKPGWLSESDITLPDAIKIAALIKIYHSINAFKKTLADEDRAKFFQTVKEASQAVITIHTPSDRESIKTFMAIVLLSRELVRNDYPAAAEEREPLSLLLKRLVPRGANYDARLEISENLKKEAEGLVQRIINQDRDQRHKPETHERGTAPSYR